MRLFVIALVGAALVCTTNDPVLAQRAMPVAVTSLARTAPTLEAQRPPRVEADHPRALLVASVAATLGVVGGVAGYFVGEQRCAHVTDECWDHFATVPLGYVLGVALGGGVTGMAEGCRTALLRSTGGAALGMVLGVEAALINGYLWVITVPVGPVLGATWLVHRCRTPARARSTPAHG